VVLNMTHWRLAAPTNCAMRAAVIKCPSCGSPELRRSATRTSAERVRRWMLGGDLFRCRACDWRGWRTLDGPAKTEKKKSKAPTIDPAAALGAVVLILLIGAAIGLLVVLSGSMYS
jgi:hypothetical protein